MWIPPRPPDDEVERLSELHSYAILDTPPEASFDRIARIAQRGYRADAAHLSFMDSEQQWLKAKTDDRLPDWLPRGASVCTLVVSTGHELVIEDLATACGLEEHPVNRDGPWRFYAGVPLHGARGHVIGTLCVLNTSPGTPTSFNIDVLRDLAAVSANELGLVQENAELYRLSTTDPLTEVANRRMFDAELERTARRCLRTGRSAALLVIDLDHFKEVNDVAGHAAGDAALAAFAGLLRSHATRPDDLAARIGGEEFALILDGADTAAGATVAAILIEHLARAGFPHPVRGQLTASIGVATYVPGEDRAAWLGRADRALYDAKRSGRATARIA